MAHHLVLFLGTGSLAKGQTPQEVVRTREYRTARYARVDASGTDEVETPYVGEALLRLYPETFTHVHLFGTTDSMWDALWLHIVGDGASEADQTRYLELAEAVRGRSLANGHLWIDALAERLTTYYGVGVTIEVLPLPEGEAATWVMFERLADLPGLRSGDALSLDVTHGLRIQPLFLLLAARYLLSIVPGLTLQHVFYGALDLHRKGTVPVYDLRAHMELFDWIDAARAFARYGDAGPVAELLAGHQAQRFTHFSQVVQLNALRDVREDARQLVAAFSNVPGDAPISFKWLLPALLEVPRQIMDAQQDWQAKMRLAQRHVRAQNVGLGVLAAYEAVLDRVALACGITDRSGEGTSDALRRIATGHHMYPNARAFYERSLPFFKTRTRVGTWSRWKRDSDPAPSFGQVTETLRMIRNALAHADEGLGRGDFEPREVYRLVDEGLFDYLFSAMAHPAFDGLAENVKAPPGVRT